jgi:ketosteroid isomerase-like protein
VAVQRDKDIGFAFKESSDIPMKNHKIIAILVAVLVLASCARESEEARILELMSRIEKLVENKDLSGLLMVLTDDYSDFEGRNKMATEDLVDDYFRSRFGIIVHLLHAKVEDITPGGETFLETDVVLSSGGAEVLRKIVRFAGDFYRFKLKLRKTPEGWRINRSEWKYLSLNDLFPESLPILKKFFPGA